MTRILARRSLLAGGGGPVPGLLLQLDASGLSAGPLATWPDLSGGGNDATQATGGLQPTVVAAVQNGLPGVSFDGTNDMMTLAGLGVTLDDSCCFFVYRAIATGSSYGAILTQAASTGFWHRSAGHMEFYNHGGESTNTADGTSRLVTCQITAGALAWYLNGAADGTGSASGFITFNHTGDDGTGELFKGYQFETRVYDTSGWGTDHRVAVETELQAKWGV